MADKTEKELRKELKQPDAFQKAGGEAQAWLQEHQGLIVGAIGTVLVVGLGIGLWSQFSKKCSEQASQELGEALEVVSRPVGPAGEQPLPGAPAPFATEKEKDEAIVKQMREFLSSHGSAPTAHAAALPLAQAAYRLGQYDDALKAFGDYLAKASKDEPLRAVALEGQGYAHEAKGELDQAYAAFESLAQQNASEFLEGMGPYHQARILIRQGKKEEAAKLLVDIPVKAPNSAAARLAGERISQLVAEGVLVPKPSTPAADAGVATP